MKYHNTHYRLNKKIIPNTINYESQISVLPNQLDREIIELENKFAQLKNQTLMLNKLSKEKRYDSLNNADIKITSPIKKIQYKKYNPVTMIRKIGFTRSNVKTLPTPIFNKSYEHYKNFNNKIIISNENYYKNKYKDLCNQITKKDKIISKLQNLVKESLDKLNEYKKNNIILQDKIEKIENAFNDIRKNTRQIINDYQRSNNSFINYKKVDDNYSVGNYLSSNINFNGNNISKNTFINRNNNSYFHRLRSDNGVDINNCFRNNLKARNSNIKNILLQRSYAVKKNKSLLNLSK